MNAAHSSNLVPDGPGFVELQRQVHYALLAQHPEWILPNGEAPTCDSYDARFAELLSQLGAGAMLEITQANSVSSQMELQYA